MFLRPQLTVERIFKTLTEDNKDVRKGEWNAKEVCPGTLLCLPTAPDYCMPSPSSALPFTPHPIEVVPCSEHIAPPPFLPSPFPPSPLIRMMIKNAVAFDNSITQLVEDFRHLPLVGETAASKSQEMNFHTLNRPHMSPASSLFTAPLPPPYQSSPPTPSVLPA